MTADPLPLWGTIVLLVIILINAYFSAVRKAIASVNKANIREMAEEGNSRAEKALKIIEKLPDSKLSIRCLNVFLYMLFCLTALYSYVGPVSGLLDRVIGNPGAAFGVAAVLTFLISTVFLMALGEMVPRRIALQHTEGITVNGAVPVGILNVVMKPFMVLVWALSFVVLKVLRQRTDLNDNEYSEENIVEMLEAGRESGELKEEGKKMITGVFAFDDILAYEIMTPRTDVFAIDINDPADEYIDELMELRYSRIPVYEDDSDNIIGILYIKDYLIKAREDGFENVDIKSILRTPYFVPETKNIDSLFFELQKTKQHIAILIDEYGGFCGIVTMEDIIEEVMGDIDDEYDEEEEEIREIGRNLYIVEGSMDIDDLNEELGLNLESEDSETIGGFLIELLGEIPDEENIGKEIFFENCVFTIKTVKDRRIEQITIKINDINDKVSENG
ncbi:MAG: hemolysin family protein [Clostridiales bacterium]|nr:hemolysin family protein [Clostridiales bacterium]MDD7130591.1 hemolysin family protein [Bacillota bacterium]